MGLTDRINHPDRRQVVVPPAEDRREEPKERRRQPQWLERMQRDGLPPKDMTGRVAA